MKSYKTLVCIMKDVAFGLGRDGSEHVRVLA